MLQNGYLVNKMRLVNRWSGSSPFGRGRIGGGWAISGFRIQILDLRAWLSALYLQSRILNLRSEITQPPLNPLLNKEGESIVKNLTYIVGTILMNRAPTVRME